MICPLQHTATRCNILQHTATHCNALQHTATHCNTHMPAHGSVAYVCCSVLQCVAVCCMFGIRELQCVAACCILDIRDTPICKPRMLYIQWMVCILQHTATRCNTLQHTATHICQRLVCTRVLGIQLGKYVCVCVCVCVFAHESLDYN